MVDYIADYLENIRDRRVFPDVKPGYMREMLPENPPNDGEAWERIFKDVEGVIMPGVNNTKFFCILMIQVSSEIYLGGHFCRFHWVNSSLGAIHELHTTIMTYL